MFKQIIVVIIMVGLLSACLPNPNLPGSPATSAPTQGGITNTNPTPVASTPAATATTNPNDGKADVRKEVGTMTTNNWNVTLYEGVTDQMKGWAKELKTPALDWSKFPNEDFPGHSFKAKDGVEYGMAESAYCQRNQTCDVNVPAMHYRLVTGDYTIKNVDECGKSTNTAPGCGIMLINVGEITAMFRESKVDYGFTVEGLYFNGDAMPTTIWALTSNTAYNMLNKGGSVMGISFPVNKGANCSSAYGCKSVRLAVVVMSGNHILLKAITSISK